ncbi:protein of unknown function [Taphrina deformans PYCC 5710]|uniref:Uncharacterized protein n=1 Tax=Taphrina deformans (strain PYCC 5710 / ATCC 11124 / CBS 356.35 / IMI 108563 / JCM 9778 / NBRC 8474) TaxID=1097556 RepID=R4X7Q0_TAPDE|nr:protein of unknown function [Taphrina deformans PYCC 5710]|eukprot:CCG81198.1 protein of unknown function [Taphrina deformans PYCC 5710]
MDDLIPPEVVIVGGLSTRANAERSRYREQEPSSFSAFSFDVSSNRHSFLSMHSASHSDHAQRQQQSHQFSSQHHRQRNSRDGQSLSSFGGSASRRGSSPSVGGRPSMSTDNGSRTDMTKLRAERAQAKRELKEKTAALKALEKSNKKASPTASKSDLDSEEALDMSFTDFMLQGPVSRTAVPTKEELKQQKLDLKAHAKALKEEEKMAKSKAAVEARNAKIDAHDRAAREKAAQKAAQKQVKIEAATRAWNAQARADSVRLWEETRGTETLLAKAHALKV